MSGLVTMSVAVELIMLVIIILNVIILSLSVGMLLLQQCL
jgi:hypothetical protein